MKKKALGFEVPEDKQIMLPTSEEAFEKLIDHLVERYKLPDRDHAATVVANRIMHLPPDQATCSYRYLGHCVLKNIAYQIAQSKGSMIAHRHQIADLKAILVAEPTNQEARDALMKSAADGSDLAKEACKELDIPFTQPKAEEAGAQPPANEVH